MSATLHLQTAGFSPMPFGNSSVPSSRRDTTTIAQRFNAGTGQSCVAPVPKGRLNPSSAGRVPFRPALGRPFGTWGRLTAKPSVETLGYSRMSLRDKDRRPGQRDFRKAMGLAAMPFGNSTGLLSRRDTITIAQRFNAGTGQFCVAPVPKGRLNPTSSERVLFTPAVGRPFGTWGRLTAKPSVETLGYSRVSLRDKDRRPGQRDFRKAMGLAGPRTP